MSDKGILESLFDLSFSNFVTTRVLKLLFVLAVVGSGIWTLIFIVTGFKEAGVLAGLLFLLLSPLVFLLSVVGARIWCEMVIVMFRIAENTTMLVEQNKAASDVSVAMPSTASSDSPVAAPPEVAPEPVDADDDADADTDLGDLGDGDE